MQGANVPMGLGIVVLAVLTVVGWLVSARSPGLQHSVRESYRRLPSWPLFALRLLLVSAPAWAVPLGIFGVALALGREAGAWAFAAICGWATVALPLSLRTPPLLAPSWLRDEIADGRLEVQVPRRWDVGCMWYASLFALVGMVSTVLLIVEFGATQ